MAERLSIESWHAGEKEGLLPIINCAYLGGGLWKNQGEKNKIKIKLQNHNQKVKMALACK